jgi:hypothetical protein
MLNSLHLKRSEDCNLNLIKLNTDVDSYVPYDKQLFSMNRMFHFLYIYNGKSVLQQSPIFAIYRIPSTIMFIFFYC